MRLWKSLAILSALGAAECFAQPAAPTTADLPCQAAAGADEVAIPLDSGFVSIFNGTDLKGWWNNCTTEDAQANRSQGGIFRADPVEKAIYSTQRSGGGGSMLVTNKKWGSHEIVLDLWPDWGNDAGLFHRTTAAGKAYQTVIDYKSNNCVGGSYPQEMESVTPQLFYNCSYFFANAETSPIKAGTGNAGIDRTGFNFADMWNPEGWNQLRVKVFGNPPRHQSWMRSSADKPWTQVLNVTWPASYSNAVSPTGHIGFQIHYGAYWTANSKGNWYRNIKIRELDNAGNPVATPVAAREARVEASFRLAGGALSGRLERDARVTVRDLAGRVLASFRAPAGNFERTLDVPAAQGVLLVEVAAGSAAKAFRVAAL